MAVKKHKRLRDRMEELGYTNRRIASEIGISAATFGQKLNGNYQFTWQEIVDISRILGLKNPYNWFEYEGVRG